MNAAALHPDYDALIDRIRPLFQDDYYQFVFSFAKCHYAQRVDMVQFVDRAMVLDAGCGYGQWTEALARRNGHVVAIDRSPNMVVTTKLYAEAFGIDNIEVREGELPHLDFPDNTFDLIWCWGLMMFVNRRTTLREFHRILKPGGRVLVGCCNAPGRWVFKLLKALRAPTASRGAIATARDVLRRGADPDAVPNHTTRRAADRLCREAGLLPIAADADGHIDLSGRGRRLPMFARRYAGLEHNIEFVAEKPGSGRPAATAPAR
jgi:ubiquinone/menaquinone biosynthesis C-methylase UbiE